MDIRKVAMFLAGRLPPYYGKSNLRTFTKKLRVFAKEEFTIDEMNFIQQQAKNIDEEIYFNVLDDLWGEATDKQEEGKKSKEDVIKLMKSLGVKDEVLGIEEINEPIKDYPKTIGLITPFDNTGTIRKELLNGLANNFGYNVLEVKMETDGDGHLLWDSITGFLDKYRLYIVDLRNQNINVAIELGYILAKKKECIVITDQDLPSDIKGFKYIKPETISVTAGTGGTYEDELNEIEEDLKSKLNKAIKAKIDYFDTH